MDGAVFILRYAASEEAFNGRSLVGREVFGITNHWNNIVYM